MRQGFIYLFGFFVITIFLVLAMIAYLDKVSDWGRLILIAGSLVLSGLTLHLLVKTIHSIAEANAAVQKMQLENEHRLNLLKEQQEHRIKLEEVASKRHGETVEVAAIEAAKAILEKWVKANKAPASTSKEINTALAKLFAPFIHAIQNQLKNPGNGK